MRLTRHAGLAIAAWVMTASLFAAPSAATAQQICAADLNGNGDAADPGETARCDEAMQSDEPGVCQKNPFDTSVAPCSPFAVPSARIIAVSGYFPPTPMPRMNRQAEIAENTNGFQAKSAQPMAPSAVRQFVMTIALPRPNLSPANKKARPAVVMPTR